MEIPNLIDIQLASYERFLQRRPLQRGRGPGPPGARGGVPEHVPDREPERRHAARVLRLHPRRAEHQVRRARVQAEGPHLRHPPQGEDQPRLPEHGRDPAEGDLHGGHPPHDRQGHLHHQRRRARGGQPDPPLARASSSATRRASTPRASSPTAAPGSSSRSTRRRSSSTPRSTARRGSSPPCSCAPSASRPARRSSSCSTRPRRVEALREPRTTRSSLVGRDFARGVSVEGRRAAKKLYRAGDKIHPHDVEELVHAGVKEVELIDFEHEESLHSSDDPQLLRARGAEARQGRPGAGRALQGRRDPAAVYSVIKPGEPITIENAEKDLHEHVLLAPPLRPGPGRPLQAEQEVRLRRAREDPHPHQGGHRQHDELPDRGVHRREERRRHRPPGQPPRPLGRGAAHQPAQDRLQPHGAHRQGAHVAQGDRHDQAAGPHLHQADRGRDQGVLRLQPALAVHGPGQPAGRAHPQAAPQRPRARRPLARPRRLRGARRPLHPLRPHVPDRDAGRTEHRPHRLARQLHPGQRVRLPRDPVPQGRRTARSPTRSSTSPPWTRRRYFIAQANAPIDEQRRLPREAGARAQGRRLHHPRRPRTSSTWTSRPSRSSRCPRP